MPGLRVMRGGSAELTAKKKRSWKDRSGQKVSAKKTVYAGCSLTQCSYRDGSKLLMTRMIMRFRGPKLIPLHPPKCNRLYQSSQVFYTLGRLTGLRSKISKDLSAQKCRLRKRYMLVLASTAIDAGPVEMSP